jgi:hypothetical protein
MYSLRFRSTLLVRGPHVLVNRLYTSTTNRLIEAAVKHANKPLPVPPAPVAGAELLFTGPGERLFSNLKRFSLGSFAIATIGTPWVLKLWDEYREEWEALGISHKMIYLGEY